MAGTTIERHLLLAVDAFLRQMVRRIAGPPSWRSAGGTLDEAAVAEALASRQPALNGAVAPAEAEFSSATGRPWSDGRSNGTI